MVRHAGESKEEGAKESASGAGSLMAKFARYVRLNFDLEHNVH